MSVPELRRADVRPADLLLVAGELGWRPGVDARVEVLEHGSKSSVHRVSWQAPRPGSCVVKRYLAADRSFERDFYGRLARRAPVPVLHCYGSYEDEDGSVWLALEDAGDTEPSIGSADDRMLLTEWAVNLHMGGASVGAASLPDAGPRRFAERLRTATAHLEARLGTEALDDDERDVIERCIERCRQLSRVWPQIERVCSRFPRTLVHGDLVEENLRVRATPRGPELVALDWEKVGWGVPAVDLVRVDPELYWTTAKRWLGGTRAEFDRLVLVGRIFRVLVHRWAEKSIRKAEHAEARLGRLLAELAAEGQR
jgi:aminoglycoside phosphotransferase (APT) family kinase protein